MGRHHDAVAWLLDGCELGVKAPRGGDVIAVLVGIAIESTATKDLADYLARLRSEDLEWAHLRLERISRFRVPFSVAVEEQRRAELAQWQELFQRGDFRHPSPEHWRAVSTSLYGANIFDGSTDPLERSTDIWDAVRFSFSDKRRFLRDWSQFHDRIAAEAREPYRGPFKARCSQSALTERIAQDLLSDGKSYAGWSRAEARLRLLRLQVALLRYRVKHGSFPSRLELLAPAFLDSVPRDPFGGGALGYWVEQRGKGLRIWSIGSNLKDDGGEGTWAHTKNSPDIVLRYPGPNIQAPSAATSAGSEEAERYYSD
jgi:hypothetical protein